MDKQGKRLWRTQRGSVSRGLFKIFPDDKSAREWFEQSIWPGSRKCTRCWYKYTYVAKHLKMPYFCAECNTHFSVKIGTVMEHSRISYRTWAVATYLLATRPKGVSSVQIGKGWGISQSATWLLLHKLRESWRAIARPDLMSGSRRGGRGISGRALKEHAYKKGKKTAIVCIKDRETGTVRAMPVPETAAARLVEFVESSITKDTQVFTDENRDCNGLNNHETVHIEPKHLHRYIGELV